MFGWWYIWSCLVQTGRREGRGLQASTTDFLLGTQLTSLSMQTVSLSLLRAPVWRTSAMSGVGVFRRQKLNLLFVETEQSRVCLSQNIITTNILAVTTIFTFFSRLLRFQKTNKKKQPTSISKKTHACTQKTCITHVNTDTQKYTQLYSWCWISMRNSKHTHSRTQLPSIIWNPWRRLLRLAKESNMQWLLNKV